MPKPTRLLLPVPLLPKTNLYTKSGIFKSVCAGALRAVPHTLDPQTTWCIFTGAPGAIQNRLEVNTTALQRPEDTVFAENRTFTRSD